MRRINAATAAMGVLGVSLGCQTGGLNEPPGLQLSAGPTHAAATFTPRATEPSVVTTPSITLVTDRRLVCMVNNQFMGQPQIPIEVNGQTYYGCCEMCKARLGTDAAARLSSDPVSGKTVDKAQAVIGRDSSGKTLYFESEQTFAEYARR